MNLSCASCGQPTTSDPCQECGKCALLDGRYRLEVALGSGATGQTWRATGPDGLLVTIKELPVPASASPERLEREARVLRQLDHSGIPTYVEHFIAPQGRSRVLCIVTRFVPGVTLREELEGRRYSQLEVLDVLESLLGTLCYLHERSPPVIHRDIKPDNIVRTPDGGLVLIDFGSVQDALSDPMSGGTTLTGTFGFMAPEQLLGHSSPRTDLYALGATALALLSRRAPHTLLDHRQRLNLDGVVSLHPRVIQLLNRLLDPDPERRFPSPRAARSVLRAVQGLLIGDTAPPPEVTPDTPPPDLEATLRRILREELGEELARLQQPPPEPVLAPIIHRTDLESLPVQLGVPHISQRRGWWAPQPMSPEQRAAPPHPAPIIVAAVGLFALISVLIQIVLL
ncbi:MAG: serine/threonine protein kinase [Myxococcota bacterium]|jgi:serine/threonine protein kinase